MSAVSQGVLRRARPLAERRVLGLDLVELATLLAFAALSLAVLAPLLTRGRPLSGADGLLPADQLQYFAWIREASEHVLIGNRFDLAPGDRAFLHPGFLLTGLVHAVTGLSIPATYLLLWKPAAVLLLFLGALLYVRRLLPAGGQRHAALVLALFAVMPAVALVAWTGWGGPPRQYTFDFISGEMWSGQYVWGYMMTGVAVGLMPLVLLAAERFRSDGSRRALAAAALGALLVGWLQPWQGATLVFVVVAVEAWRWARDRERPRWTLALVPAAVAVPGVYYAALGRFDAAWRLAAESNAAGAQPEWGWPWWAVALTVAPLAVPAAFALRRRARTWQDVAVRAWPLAALAVYFLPGLTFPYHALQGLALPLSILAVAAVAPLRPRPLLVVAAMALLIVPGTIHKLDLVAGNINTGRQPYFITPDDHRALDFLETDGRPGGVLATFYAGQYVPSTTGRETYVGALSWSPDFADRRARAEELMAGLLTPAQARAFVRSTHARYVYQHCGTAGNLRAALAPLTEEVRRFGCATVYVLSPTPEMAAAAGLPDE